MGTPFVATSHLNPSVMVMSTKNMDLSDFLSNRSKLVKGVREITPESIEELMKIVRLDDKDLGWTPDGKFDASWVFRGHREWDWELKAPSRRPKDQQQEWAELIQKFKKHRAENLPPEVLNRKTDAGYRDYGDERIHSLLTHVATEEDLVHNFIQLSEEIGLQIPEGHKSQDGFEVLKHNHSFPEFLPSKISQDGGNRPIHIALAQHSQIPTQMLDWTGSPLAALFFALENLRKKPEKDASVWALNLQISEQQFQFDDETKKEKANVRVVLYRSARSDIQYLNAQDGVLQYFDGGNRFFLSWGEFSSLDSLVATPRESTDAQEYLRKIRIRKEWGPEILRVLWSHGIHRARMMPTFENVRESLIQRWIRSDGENMYVSRFMDLLR